MSREEILTDLALRLDAMNAQHRRMGLPVIDAPHGLKDRERLQQINLLLADVALDVEAGRDLSDRMLRNIGAHVVAWIDVIRTRGSDRPALEAVPPVAPADGGRWQEFQPEDGAA